MPHYANALIEGVVKVIVIFQFMIIGMHHTSLQLSVRIN